MGSCTSLPRCRELGVLAKFHSKAFLKIHEDLDEARQNFFISCALILQVNPSVWTLGHVVPVLTREMFEIYGKGLALNSMEGSEAKHQAIFWYAFKTNFLNR